MKVLGAAAACGVSPAMLLSAGTLERNALMEVAAAAINWQLERDEALARRIINELAASMKRGRGG